MGEEQIARQDADGVAPEAAGRRPTPSLLTVVDHIVVKQRREVNELGRHGDVPRDRR